MEPSSCIELCIGGVSFYTTRGTLLAYSQTFFSGLVESSRTDTYSFYIDRDPMHFRYVLNHMRGSDVLPADLHALKELRVEADFYMLTTLVKLVDKALARHPGSFEYQLSKIHDSIKALRA